MGTDRSQWARDKTYDLEKIVLSTGSLWTLRCSPEPQSNYESDDAVALVGYYEDRRDELGGPMLDLH